MTETAPDRIWAEPRGIWYDEPTLPAETEYVRADLLDEAVTALEEALGFAIEANEALLVRSVSGEIPITAYNYERDQRQAYINSVTATLAKLRSKT